MPKLLRNFRIDEPIYRAATQKAERLGINLTLVVATALRDFVANAHFTISDPEIITDLPASITTRATKLDAGIRKFIAKKAAKNKDV